MITTAIQNQYSLSLEEFEKKYIEYKEAYDNEEPLITDEEFDAFEELGKHLFPHSKVFSIVGLEKDLEINHSTPMMSLHKIKDKKNGKDNINELLEWRTSKTHYTANKAVVASNKLDGCSCSLIYVNGELIEASTRGDGFKGKNIIHATEYIQYLPRSIRANFPNQRTEIRGEIVISSKNFELLKEEMKKRNLKIPKSERNIIPGLINPQRKADHDLIAYTQFIAYDILNHTLIKEIDKFCLLENMNFDVPAVEYCITDEHIIEAIEYFKSKKDSFDIKCDGLVFCLDDTSTHQYTDSDPEHKVAFKIKGDIVATPVIDIVTEISGNGRMSFVALIEPVEVDGATISRVTLHNIEYIKEHHVNVGAIIGITRSGDVIPKHEVTIVQNGEYTPPKNCPLCGSELIKNLINSPDGKVEGSFLRCPNNDCSSRELGKLNKWIKVINAKGISDKTVLDLYNNKLIKHPKDFYTLNDYDISALDGYGVKSANDIITAIMKNSVDLNHWHILMGCNIEDIGEKTVEILLNKFGNIPSLLTFATYDNLEQIDGIGEETAMIVLQNKNNIRNFYNEMNDVIRITEPKKQEFLSDKLKDKKICITGTLTKDRKSYENIIKQHGGIPASGVSKKTDYLLVGSSPGEDKTTKAKMNNVKMITEEELKKIIGG